ncbi:hypothetical protein FHX82_006418 [Amycolatopsis bartoniae]|nr:hypothetical protein [Amycolatopsis bartoniae]
MDVVADFPAGAQAAEPVQQGNGLLDDPAMKTKPGALFDAAAGEAMPLARRRSRCLSKS